MKENSIEKKLENIQNVNLITLLRQFKKEGVQNFIVLRRSNFDEILSDYKRVLKENEIYKKNSEIMSKENLSTAEQLKVEIKENFRLKNQLENNRKEYQETYKDVREELKELKKENEELRKELNEENKRCMMLAVEKQDYFEKYKYHLQQNESLTRESSNYISIQKIKDIIDRIDYDIKKTKEIISKNTNIYASYRKNDYQIVRLRAMNTKSLDIKKRLQELLESEE